MVMDVHDKEENTKAEVNRHHQALPGREGTIGCRRRPDKTGVLGENRSETSTPRKRGDICG